MALLNYKSRRSPTQNALASFVVMVIAFFGFGIIPTQWFASKFAYDPNLGNPLFSAFHVSVYVPTDWVRWGWHLADVPVLRESVHAMLLLGAASVFLSLVFGIFVAYQLGKYSPGMEGLHGTARFAERKDVDETGFINSKGHKASGVVVGSVILDGRGKVIHPHHKKYEFRYRMMFNRGKGLKHFNKTPKRDGNKRPMYEVTPSVVKDIEYLRDSGNTHIFAFCPTRSGKGVGLVLPTLLTWPHSVMVNDPKGEAYALTAGFRKSVGQDIVKFQPACTDGTGARWNPLDEIRIFTDYDVSDAQMIMSMACDPKGEGLDDYFDKAGYEFLTSLALHMRYAEKNGTLAGVAYFLGDPNWDNDKQMYSHMMSSVHDPEGKMKWRDSTGNLTKTHPMVANAAKTMLNKEDKDRSGVLSTAKSLLSLYLDPIVAANTGCSDFLVRDLMTGKNPVSLYYVVGPADMERLVPLTRLFYALFIRRNAADMAFADGRSAANYTHPLLMIIDEAASLRKLPILQEALGYVAGYGIRMFFLVQDITQVEELYGDKQSFDSGAETRIVYAPNKIETAEKLARMSGKTTITEENASNSRDVIGIKAGSVSISTSKTARDLITADEFMVLHDQDMVIFVKGKPPIYGRKAFYYENPVMNTRAKMPPPPKSSVLRIATQIDPYSKVEPSIPSDIPAENNVMDRWSASREALKDKVVSSVDPLLVAVKASKPAIETTDVPVPVQPRSRYASKVKVLSPEEEQQVKELISDVVLMDRVVNISAF